MHTGRYTKHLGYIYVYFPLPLLLTPVHISFCRPVCGLSLAWHFLSVQYGRLLHDVQCPFVYMLMPLQLVTDSLPTLSLSLCACTCVHFPLHRREPSSNPWATTSFITWWPSQQPRIYSRHRLCADLVCKPPRINNLGTCLPVACTVSLSSASTTPPCLLTHHGLRSQAYHLIRLH